MRILIVVATAAEIAPVAAALGEGAARGTRLTSFPRGRHDIDVLTTGVGMVATAAWCSRALATTDYAIALNFGVCGSFVAEYPPGAVVHVTTDRFSEIGAEDGEGFLTAQELGLVGDDEFPFQAGLLVNEEPPPIAALDRLPAVAGITVNTVHGDAASIARIVERCRPDVESMEGAAFMYACRVQGVPHAQVRAVSNRVERRNRESWRMIEAIRGLAAAALGILDQA
ncbi:MAG: futalosine hydrolase [Vicinamibacterales bacterium]